MYFWSLHLRELAVFSWSFEQYRWFTSNGLFSGRNGSNLIDWLVSLFEMQIVLLSAFLSSRSHLPDWLLPHHLYSNFAAYFHWVRWNHRVPQHLRRGWGKIRVDLSWWIWHGRYFHRVWTWRWDRWVCFQLVERIRDDFRCVCSSSWLFFTLTFYKRFYMNIYRNKAKWMFGTKCIDRYH